MINPFIAEATRFKRVLPDYRKVYHGAFQYPRAAILITRRSFPTAREAKEYANRVLGRWCKLYHAAITQAVTK